jgi:hypothetical protein
MSQAIFEDAALEIFVKMDSFNPSLINPRDLLSFFLISFNKTWSTLERASHEAALAGSV